MAVSSYNAIGTIAVSSSQTEITFSNIPQIYTDLILVATVKTSATPDLWIRVNGDSGSNYSYTELDGNGTSTGSTSANNQTNGLLTDWYGTPTTDNSHICIVNFNNYSNNLTYKTAISRANRASSGVDAVVSMWRSLSAINSLTLRFSNGATTFSQGTVISLYGVGANQLKASGGNIIVSDGTYWYHAFTSSGTFTPNSTLSCDVLVVAGGGGGGQDGGGGGAGGVFYATAQSLSSTQTVTIGGGGAGGSLNKGTNGSNSQFGSLTVGVGGGGGGSASNVNPGNGGSGGGGQRNTSNAGGTSTQTGTGGTGYGFAGGSGLYASPAYGAGGGGGASAAGGNGTSTAGGAGGAGLSTWSAWLNTTNTGVAGYIAGGGGGATYNNSNFGAGGAGGGAAAMVNNPAAAVSNSGGGGGGSSATTGGAGGSGLVIVRYAI
jgi:hypothetical protein